MLHIENNILTDDQREDFNRAFNTLYVENKKGILFTNKAGTGKTHTGCGIIQGLLAIEKKKVLIIAPTDKILSGWEGTLLHDFNIVAQRYDNQVADITTTTYAKYRQSPNLLETVFDLIIFDESQYLLMSASGDNTEGSRMMKMHTGHNDFLYQRAYKLYPNLSHEMALAKAEKKHEAAAKKTKVIFLSATPFAYHKCLDYAEGVLFDYDEVDSSFSYNKPSKDQKFLIDNFGYQFKGSRLCRPDENVDQTYNEVEFHNRLVNSGVLSYRGSNSQVDYSRHFISASDAVGQLLDAASTALALDRRFYLLKDSCPAITNKLRVKQILESLKAQHAVERAKKHIALGRKVVVYHGYHKIPSINPFDFESSASPELKTNSEFWKQVDLFFNEFAYFKESRFSNMKPVIDTFVEAFGDKVGLFNGKISKKKRSNTMDEFNKPNSSLDVIVIQDKAGREGVNLMDTNGNDQRVLMQLGLPSDPVSCIQIEARILRYGTKTNAIYEYFNTGTFFEVSEFSKDIGAKSSTVENLACGAHAASLTTSFVNGYLNSEDTDPSIDQGTGGKNDASTKPAKNIWDAARSRFFSLEKKTTQTKSAEGTDYFSTPSPVGLFMMKLANPKSQDRVLEPSAGDGGGIALWTPKRNPLTCIEESPKLVEKLMLTVDGDATIRTGDFMDFNPHIKFNRIVTNPPFGRGGKTAIEHLSKCITHLKPGFGRLVAIIPDSEQCDKRLDGAIEQHNEDQQRTKKLVYKAATYKLPSITFKHAATLVRTKIVVIEATSNRSKFHDSIHRELDFSNETCIKALFDSLEAYADENFDEIHEDVILNVGTFPKFDTDALPVILKRTEDLSTEPDLEVLVTAYNKKPAVGQLSLFG